MGVLEVQNTISHSENGLPELEIQAGFSKFAGFWKIVGSMAIDNMFYFTFFSIWTREETIIGKAIDFTPEVEDEVIRGAVSHKLDTLLVKP